MSGHSHTTGQPGDSTDPTPHPYTHHGAGDDTAGYPASVPAQQETGYPEQHATLGSAQQNQQQYQRGPYQHEGLQYHGTTPANYHPASFASPPPRHEPWAFPPPQWVNNQQYSNPKNGANPWTEGPMFFQPDLAPQPYPYGSYYTGKDGQQHSVGPSLTPRQDVKPPLGAWPLPSKPSASTPQPQPQLPYYHHPTAYAGNPETPGGYFGTTFPRYPPPPQHAVMFDPGSRYIPARGFPSPRTTPAPYHIKTEDMDAGGENALALSSREAFPGSMQLARISPSAQGAQVKHNRYEPDDARFWAALFKGRPEKVHLNSRKTKSSTTKVLPPECHPDQVYPKFSELIDYLQDNLPPDHKAVKSVEMRSPLDRYQYTVDGMLAPGVRLTSDDIKKFVAANIAAMPPPELGNKYHGFEILVQRSPTQCSSRLRNDNNCCRFEKCPEGVKTKIKAGWLRVALEVHPYWAGEGYKDPVNSAVSLHLWCFEQIFSHQQISEWWEKKIVRIDDRILNREPKNPLLVQRDTKPTVLRLIKDWMESRDGNILEYGDDARRCDEAELRDTPNKTLGCAESLFHAGQLLQLDNGMWKIKATPGNGTRQHKRDECNDEIPNEQRNTMDHHRGNLKRSVAKKEGKEEWKKTKEGQEVAEKRADSKIHKKAGQAAEAARSQAEPGEEQNRVQQQPRMQKKKTPARKAKKSARRQPREEAVADQECAGGSFSDCVEDDLHVKSEDSADGRWPEFNPNIHAGSPKQASAASGPRFKVEEPDYEPHSSLLADVPEYHTGAAPYWAHDGQAQPLSPRSVAPKRRPFDDDSDDEYAPKRRRL